jgi:class 3 adenylate cyclase
MWRRLADFRGSFGPLGSFDGITDIVVKHEGLVDKIIGDAVHTLFNVPFDLIAP